ncbi:hypothetical protein ACFY3B_31375 [Micromonospora parva]|uniref:Uncharacterized protein n=1 Tax=Micromonospora parva TaxID=1464048 RepID=A0ABW6W2H9_9ACTN
MTGVGIRTRSAKSRQSTPASRGRTRSYQARCSGNCCGRLTTRTLATASHSGDTAKRVIARSRAARPTSIIGAPGGFGESRIYRFDAPLPAPWTV